LGGNATAFFSHLQPNLEKFVPLKGSIIIQYVDNFLVVLQIKAQGKSNSLASQGFNAFLDKFQCDQTEEKFGGMHSYLKAMKCDIPEVSQLCR
jgi:hypothetical protein